MGYYRRELFKGAGSPLLPSTPRLCAWTWGRADDGPLCRQDGVLAHVSPAAPTAAPRSPEQLRVLCTDCVQILTVCFYLKFFSSKAMQFPYKGTTDFYDHLELLDLWAPRRKPGAVPLPGMLISSEDTGFVFSKLGPGVYKAGPSMGPYRCSSVVPSSTCLWRVARDLLALLLRPAFPTTFRAAPEEAAAAEPAPSRVKRGLAAPFEGT